MLLTAGSGYGIGAADRGGKVRFPLRFHVGGETQCTNPTGNYYVEKIYQSLFEVYEQTGTMTFQPFVH